MISQYLKEPVTSAPRPEGGSASVVRKVVCLDVASLPVLRGCPLISVNVIGFHNLRMYNY